MFNGDDKRVTRDAAIRKMNAEHGKHALYGLSYDLVEELAGDEDEIIVYRNDDDFSNHIEEIRRKYGEYGIEPRFLAVHEQRS